MDYRIGKMELKSRLIIEAPEAEVIIASEGDVQKLFVCVNTVSLSDSVESGSKSAPAKSKAEVVDDTKASKAAPKGKSKPVEEAEEEKPKSKTAAKGKPAAKKEPEYVEVENWKELKVGDEIAVKLAPSFLDEGDDPDKLYPAKIDAISKKGVVTVTFEGDDEAVVGEDGENIQIDLQPSDDENDQHVIYVADIV